MGHCLRIFRFFLFFVTVLVFHSCEETLFETDISGQPVILVAPADGSQLDFTSINFNWEPIQDADQYRLQVATPDFNNPDQLALDILLDSVTTYDATLTPNLYEWRVKALNSAYETHYFQSGFEIVNNDNFPGNVVSLVSPMNNLITNAASFTLQWNSVQEASLYRVQIIDNAIDTVIDEQTTVDTSLGYNFSEGDLTWQVRAEKDGEVTLYTSRQLLVDTTVPNIPALLSPENETTLSNTSVDFTWDRTPIGGSAEIDSLYIYEDQNLSILVEKQQVSNSYQTTLMDNTTYYWLMKAFDTAGNESGDSAVFSFTINL